MERAIYSDNDAWLEARRGKVTGTRLKDIVVKRGTKPKKGFYELIAERIAIPRDPNESRMDRGHTLEAEAVARLAQETGLPFVQVDNELWARDDNADIAYSPDGYTVPDPAREDCEHAANDKLCARCGKIDTACEIKCLNSASHIEGFITREVPSEYIEQTRQAFAVNDDLQTLYFAMYDPSLPPTCDFFYIIITREEVAEEVAYLLDYQRQTLSDIEAWVGKLTF